jgi:hypothetical protein
VQQAIKQRVSVKGFAVGILTTSFALIPNPGGANFAPEQMHLPRRFALIPNPGGANSLCVISSSQAGYQS